MKQGEVGKRQKSKGQRGGEGKEAYHAFSGLFSCLLLLDQLCSLYSFLPNSQQVMCSILILLVANFTFLRGIIHFTDTGGHQSLYCRLRTQRP